jgi:citrate synthase
VGSKEAARRLGVSRATLYAYVSRRLIERRAAVDGRTSLYAVDDLDRLAGRTRRPPESPRPTLDVQITSAVAHLDELGLSYRGRDVAELAASASFEQVAELLWTGEMPSAKPSWPVAAASDVEVARRVIAALGPAAPPLARLLVIAPALAAQHAADPPPDAARRMITVVAALDAPARRGPMAARLARAWHRRPSPELTAAVDRALVLLADHELATSTLAVRVATSVRTDSYAALAAGLATVSGRLHGSAAAAAHGLLVESSRHGPAAAVARRRDAGERVAGFGHTVYRTGDPRLEPLLGAVRTLPDPRRRMVTVDALLAEAGRSIVQRPNVDFGLAALAYVGGLDPDVPIFAIARLAGWAAHAVEELDERPVRFRGLARPTPWARATISST